MNQKIRTFKSCDLWFFECCCLAIGAFSQLARAPTSRSFPSAMSFRDQCNLSHSIAIYSSISKYVRVTYNSICQLYHVLQRNRNIKNVWAE
jgi:hypothetical protein